MKAIYVTQELKDKNADFFNGVDVDTLVARNVPINFWGVEKQNAGNYRSREDLQELDGWKDIVNPVIGENQKRGELVMDGEVATYEVLELTQEELDAKIPTQISKLNFKIGLLTNHGITNDMVQAFFDTLTDPIQKAKLELLWFESSFFERNDPNLINFAPYLGITQEDIKQIFIDFNGY